jgi:ABC-2 type transport system permease protein
MNTVLLRFLDLFRWLFVALKVDYLQLRAIVATKLVMDNRRQVISYRQNNNKAPDNTFLWTTFFYGLFGIFIAMVIYSLPYLIIALILFFSYIMVMVAMTLITDFSAILLDTSDNTIILPRPVDSRTLFVARSVHIFLYLGLLTVGLTAAPALVILLKYGSVMFLLFMIGTVLSVITAISFTNALYLLIMQFANEEKLKSVINYFQIVMAVFIMGGYQILPRILGRFDLEDFAFEIQWWAYLTPPVWIAGALEAFYERTFDIPHLALIACAIIIPITGFYLVNRYLTPLFNRKLGAMGSSTESQVTKITPEKKSFASTISGWFTTNTLERGTFELIYTILGRDRKIKLKVYPTFGYVIIFGLIFLIRGHEDFSVTLQDLPNTRYYVMLLYLSFMILQVAFYEIPYSDDFKASWIYFSAPLEKPGVILSGTLKALFVRFFIPGYAIVTIVVLVVWGISALDDIVFGFFNNFLMLLTIAFINKKTLPLSMEPSVRNQTGSFVRSMLMMIMLAILGFGHYMLTSFPIVLMATIPLQMIGIYFLLRTYKGTEWKELTL